MEVDTSSSKTRSVDAAICCCFYALTARVIVFTGDERRETGALLRRLFIDNQEYPSSLRQVPFEGRLPQQMADLLGLLAQEEPT